MKTKISKHLRTAAVLVTAAAVIGATTFSMESTAQERQLRGQHEQIPGQPKQAGSQRSLPVQFRLEQPHRIEIEGIASLQGVRVTSVIAGQVDVRSAGNPNNSRVKLAPGLVTYKRLRLSGELPSNREVVQWFDATRDGNVRRANMLIVLMDYDGEEIEAIAIENAMPVGLEIDIPSSQWHLTVAFESFDTEVLRR